MNTKIMGILNVTPDSFYDGGKYWDAISAVKRFHELKKYSDIIDIGAESTRPGAEKITAEEEINRLMPILNLLLPADIPVSIDTYHAKTAEIALYMGANIINTVDFNEDTAKSAAKYGAKIVLMARDTLGEFDNTINCLNSLINRAKENGVEEGNIILDIGIGFLGGAKADLSALKNLRGIREYYKNFPILVGASRKSFIGEVLGVKKKQRLAGSLAANLYAAKNGADILRVHDAKEMSECLKMIEAIEGGIGYD